MMDSVAFTPVIIGSQGQYAADGTEIIVGFPGLKERAMAAVMLDDEYTD
jgi:hypothetical protein